MRGKEKRLTAEEIISNCTIGEVNKIFSELSNSDREKLVSEMWALYHKRAATKGV